MKRVLTAAVLIPLVLFAVLRAPLWLFLLLTALVAVAAAWEYLDIVAGYGLQPLRALGCLCVLAPFGIYGWQATTSSGAALGILLSFFLLVPFLMLAAAMRQAELKPAMLSAAMSYLALPYIGLPLLLLAMMRRMSMGWAAIVFLFLAVWVGDTAAMYVGKSMGRHKLAPRISPGKTIEGTVASLLFAVAVCCLYAHFLYRIASVVDAPVRGGAPLWLTAIVAAAINAAAQLGDLLESALKRGAGVKDSGSLLPGHGGMLDRIDALLLAMPVAFILIVVCGFQSRLLNG